jgi:hypothetical protein
LPRWTLLGWCVFKFKFKTLYYPNKLPLKWKIFFCSTMVGLEIK